MLTKYVFAVAKRRLPKHTVFSCNSLEVRVSLAGCKQGNEGWDRLGSHAVYIGNPGGDPARIRGRGFQTPKSNKATPVVHP